MKQLITISRGSRKAINTRASGKSRKKPGSTNVNVGFLSRCTRSPIGAFNAAAR